MLIGRDLIYNEHYSLLERHYIRVFGVPINGLRIRARRILPNIHTGYRSVLDAGCGPGVFTFEIARKLPLARVLGIDIDKELIEQNRRVCRKAGLINCSFECRDILEMPDRETFDLILSVDNLEHLEDDARALAHFSTSLCPGGDLLLHVPGLFRRWPIFKWKTNFHVNGHIRPGYTKEDIVAKVEQAGLSVQRADYTYGWIETMTNNISYWITGAEMRNKELYAVAFPVLNFISYFGRKSAPKIGAGVLLIATKAP